MVHERSILSARDVYLEVTEIADKLRDTMQIGNLYIKACGRLKSYCRFVTGREGSPIGTVPSTTAFSPTVAPIASPFDARCSKTPLYLQKTYSGTVITALISRNHNILKSSTAKQDPIAQIGHGIWTMLS